MRPAEYVDQIRQQSAALRAAAGQAGPDAPIPTCPGWTAHALVDHIARVQAWATVATRTDPEAGRPPFHQRPENWHTLLAWWDDRLAALVDRLTGMDASTPCWGFSSASHTVGFWARRMAHETAIHRLDAEYAVAGSVLPTAVPTLVFPPAFAADGAEEFLDRLLPLDRRWAAATATGRLLVHAADASRAWELHFYPGRPPQLTPPAGSATEAEATLVGTADAVYRRVWGRPSTAVITGDVALAALVHGR